MWKKKRIITCGECDFILTISAEFCVKSHFISPSDLWDDYISQEAVKHSALQFAIFQSQAQLSIQLKHKYSQSLCCFNWKLPKIKIRKITCNYIRAKI